MPVTDLTMVATTYADYRAALGCGYDNVSGLAFLLFANECVMSVTNIVFIIDVTCVAYCSYFD
jgi:hypothetical protein